MRVDRWLRGYFLRISWPISNTFIFIRASLALFALEIATSLAVQTLFAGSVGSDQSC